MHQAKSDQSAPAERSSLFAHPIGFWFFFWGEFAERCCYYGMVTILMLYMIDILHFEDSQASRIFNYFIAGCYLLPLLGGYIADNFLGKYRTIVFFAIPYIVGQFLLGITSFHNTICLYISLALLCMGAGVIKPNISTLMGMTYDQFRPGETRLRSDAFAMFYAAINIGASLSGLCVPAIRNHFGADDRAYAIAFMFPAALMVFSFLIFTVGKPFYAKETSSRVQLTPQERHQRWIVLRRLLGLFLVVTIFWSIFNQSSSTWMLFARDYVHLELAGYPLSADQLPAFNPVLILILLPLITAMWHLLARFGWNPKPTSKMLFGFVLTTVTIAVIACAAFRGTHVIVAGAPASLAAAEKTIPAIAQLAVNSRADEVAQELIAGEVAAAEAENASATNAIRAEAKPSEKLLADAPPNAVAVATAKQAAVASLQAAKQAWALMADPANASTSQNLDQLKTLAQTASAAAKAARTSSQQATEAAGKSQTTALKPPFDITRCGAVATQASTATAAVERCIDASNAGNHTAARTQAAVAVVGAAQACVTAAEAAAQFDQARIPDVIPPTVQAIASSRIYLLWQIIPYIAVTFAEICISVVGLELAFAAAPATMKSFVTACWLLTVFFGSMINAEITPLYNETVAGVSLTPNWYFLMFAILMIPVTLAFLLIARRFERPT